MIKPNLINSHDWHVQPYCQRSLKAVRLSGALLDRDPKPDGLGVLELDALPESAFAQRSSVILREPFKSIEHQAFGQAESDPSTLKFAGHFDGIFFSMQANYEQTPSLHAGNAPSDGFAQRKFSMIDQQKALEPLGLSGVGLPSHAMACSLWDSLQGFRGVCLT